MPKSKHSRSVSRSASRSPSYNNKYHDYKARSRFSYKRGNSKGDFYQSRDFGRSRSRSSSNDDRRIKNDTRSKRRNSRSRSSSKGKRVIFDFEIFLEAPFIKRLIENDERIIKAIQDDIGIYKIAFDHDLSIPGLDGSVIKLSDESYSKKQSALLKILNQIEDDKNSKKDYHKCSVIILVPEGMVSLLIGTKGRQINNIMRESRSHIVVNPAIHKMTYRTVKIDGRPDNIAIACKIIYQTLENISPNVEKIEKTPKPLELHKTRISAKLVFPKSSVGYIIGKEGTWIKDLCDKCGVSIKFQQDTSIRCLRKDDAICIIKGKLSGVINAVVITLRRSQEYESMSKHYASDAIKLLIPNNFVTKLIGAKGCMIREIAAKAGGAQIKIMSDKQSEREYQDCVVAIAGSLANKQDAVCYILEQIEIFKNGGPILLNGKAINENLAQQFRHSVPPRDSSGVRNGLDEINPQNEKDYQETNENESDMRKYIENRRSRSVSKSVDHTSTKGSGYDETKEEFKEDIGTRENGINVKNEDVNIKQEETQFEIKADPRAEKYKELGQAVDLKKKRSESPKEHRRSHPDVSPHRPRQKKDSQSRSVSHSRSRSRSKSMSVRVRREKAGERSRSRSSERNTYGRGLNNDLYKNDSSYGGSSPKSRQAIHGTDRKDVTKNSHYIDAKGDLRATTTVIVPNYLVPYLIGKNGEVIKTIETKTTAKISFQRENRSYDSAPINTAEGIRGRIVSISGPPKSLVEAFGLLIEEIIKLEKSINGTRYQKSQ